ncbi:MAG: polysaccharide deacetylase [Chitinophagaceae bacterium]|nr:polysaccharide deacetylase [Chitinophagaceae bacterium]
MASAKGGFTKDHGAIIRGDSTHKKIALVFTGDEFAEGGNIIAQTLKKEKVKASFFLTGNFYRNPVFKNIIRQLKKDGHYLGSHSDKHLLYCDWDKRDSLLVSKEQFTTDLEQSYRELNELGIRKADATYFLPPYEWFNDSITAWTKELGLQLINFTPGTRSHADYTFPGPSNYQSSAFIYQSIIDYEKNHPAGLNGFILLLHIGTDPRRTDKFYNRLAGLIAFLKDKNYTFQTVKALLHK